MTTRLRITTPGARAGRLHRSQPGDRRFDRLETKVLKRAHIC